MKILRTMVKKPIDDEKCSISSSNDNIDKTIRLSEKRAKYVKKILKTPMSKSMIKYIDKRYMGFIKLSNTKITDLGCEYPIMDTNIIVQLNNQTLDDLVLEKINWPYKTISDYRNVYLNKTITPCEIISKLITLCESEKIVSLNAIMHIRKEDARQAAADSTKRFKDGKQLSIVDGIPFFVKEDIKIKNCTQYYGSENCATISEETAFCIQKLLDAGALLMGTTTMTTFGINTLGYNTSQSIKTAKNPWDVYKYPGGSSSGSAIVVSCGLCPFAIAGQYFDSINIPSSFTGVVGLKPTLSRVSNSRFIVNENQNKVACIGPISCCVADSAVVYGIIAGKDNTFAFGLLQPAITLPNFKEFNLKDIKIGICRKYNENADLMVIECLNSVVDKLIEKGCQLVEIVLPDLKETQIVLSALECESINMLSSIFKDKNIIQKSKDIWSIVVHRLGKLIDTNVVDIIKCQRSESVTKMKEIFEQIDIIILPTTGITAPTISKNDDKYGVFDTHLISEISPFVSIPSFTGLPAISLNVGYGNTSGLPVSIQLIAKWWREDILLSTANEIENMFPLIKSPSVFSCPLDEIKKEKALQ